MTKNLLHSSLIQALVAATFLLCACLGGSYYVYRCAQTSLFNTVQEYLLSAVKLAALQTNETKHTRLATSGKIHDQDYQSIVMPYHDILKTHHDIKYIYTYVIKNDQFYFIIDTELPSATQEVESANVNELYEEVTPKMRQTVREKKPFVEDEPFSDEWGTFLSAYAPIVDTHNNLKAIIGVDMQIDDYLLRLIDIRRSLIVAASTGCLLSLCVGILVYRIRSKEKSYQNELQRHKAHLELEIADYVIELQSAKEIAETSNEAKSIFLSNITHELRTPLHAILNYASIGKKRIPANDQNNIAKYFSNIHTAGDRLLNLINDLLDLSKLESGKLSYHMEEYDLARLIHDAVNGLETLIEAKRLRSQIDLHTNIIVMRLDQQRIIQVIINLLSNAIKFSPEGSTITITTQHSISVHNNQQVIRCSVQDEGNGIPENEIKSIFDAFIQSSQTRSGAGGTGLGLSICRNIIEGHQGHIWAENNPEGGATFYVELPLTHHT